MAPRKGIQKIPTSPASKPYVLEIENGYLVDPQFEPRLPTYREHLDFNQMRPVEKLELLKEHWDGMDLPEEEVTDNLGKPLDQFTVADVVKNDATLFGWLDDTIDLETLGDHAAAKFTEFAEGIALYSTLGEKKASDLGLAIIEGDQPGSSFVGVQFNGDLKKLNKALASAGINFRVQEAK